MWARWVDLWAHPMGKYHWFERCAPDMYRPKCDKGRRLWINDYEFTQRAQPRHADRCKRCVAVLKRREKDEDAKG